MINCPLAFPYSSSLWKSLCPHILTWHYPTYSFLFLFANLIVLICISLITNDFEHFNGYLLTFWLSSSINFLLILSIRVVTLLNFRSSLCIQNKLSLVGLDATDIFFYFGSYLWTFCIVLSIEIKFLIMV